jgi:hypothetical protein
MRSSSMRRRCRRRSALRGVMVLTVIGTVVFVSAGQLWAQRGDGRDDDRGSLLDEAPGWLIGDGGSDSSSQQDDWWDDDEPPLTVPIPLPTPPSPTTSTNATSPPSGTSATPAEASRGTAGSDPGGPSFTVPYVGGGERCLAAVAAGIASSPGCTAARAEGSLARGETPKAANLVDINESEGAGPAVWIGTASAVALTAALGVRRWWSPLRRQS